MFNFRCTNCPDYYWDQRELARHIKMHTDYPYKCELCDQIVMTRDLLYSHITLAHERRYKCERGQLMTCDICSKTFTTKGGIRNHMLLHTGKLDLFETKFFHNNKFAIKQYLIFPFKTDKFDHICHICGWKFQSKGNLKGHLASTHTTERRFTCDVCNKT